MDDFDDDDEVEEVEVFIEPREDVLMAHGISLEAFEEAFGKAIDAYHEQVDQLDDEDEVPGISALTLQIAGREYPLEELADILINDDDSDEMNDESE